MDEDMNENENSCDYNFAYVSDDIWKSYEETFDFLKEYYNYRERDISNAQCFDSKYFCRVVEDEFITGILTNTNQFVQIKDPIPVSSVDDNIKTFTSNNLLIADMNTLTNNKVDTKRVELIKKIQLETNFFNVFRNTIRILFNDYSNSEKRKNIQDECNKQYVIYRQQLNNVIDMLHELVGENIVFALNDDWFDYRNINENNINSCYKNENDKCQVNGSICRISNTNNKCTLVLPKENLITKKDNEEFYYGRMADELIRYNRIKSFIFKPQLYLSFGSVKYNLREDEIIVLQDLLNQEFFENLDPVEMNKYNKYNTFDTAEPILTQAYTKNVVLREDENEHNNEIVRQCLKSEPSNIKSIYWKKCFPVDYSEIHYSGAKFCPLYLIVHLVEEIHGNKITIQNVKDDLIGEYKKLTNNFREKDRFNKIIDILKEESQTDVIKILEGFTTLEQIIIQENFSPVNFDLWLLLVKYKIPSFLISSRTLPESRFNDNIFLCYKEDGSHSSKYAFIVCPAMYKKSNKTNEYKLILNENKNVKINLDELKEKECFKNISESIEKYYSVEDYLDFVFKKDVKTNYKLKKKGIRNIEFIVEGEEEGNEIEKELENLPSVNVNKLTNVRTTPKKMNTRLVLEEEQEGEKEKERVDESDLFKESEFIEIVPAVKKKKKTQKRRKIKVNPLGKRGTKKNINIEFEIENN
jgi:hypothetical protein